jgi:hypothetical protein
MSAVYERAKQLAGKGVTVIPLRGKIPAIKEWQAQRGTTVEQLDEWQRVGLLQNIGIVCGEASGGLVVLDFDGINGYKAFVGKFGELADTHTVATGSGDGMHVYYRVQALPTSTGVLKVPGGNFEVKANGRQVVAPPSIHPDTGALYEIKNAKTVKELESIDIILAWVMEHNPPQETPRREAALVATAAPASSAGAQKYVQKALERMASELAGLAPDTRRNETLFDTARLMGGFAANGYITRGEVENVLRSACLSNGLIQEDGERATMATFESGFNAGRALPVEVPALQPPQPPRPTLPGEPAYTPPAAVVSDNGVITIGRTRIVKRKSLLADILRRVTDDDYMPGVPPIEFPLKCMHHLGGLARITPAGKVCALVGASGSGKTSALETVADMYVAQGVPVAIWSPEWSPDEMAERAVQRHGGVTQDELYMHELAKRLGAANGKMDYSALLPEAKRTATSFAIRSLRGWDNDVYYLDNSQMTVLEMAELVAGLRTIDNAPRVLVVDYAQLMKANEAEAEDATMYNMIQRFKAVCVYNGILGWVATQTRKDDAEANISQGDFLGTTVLNCTKNSRGRKGMVRVASDPARLRIDDALHANQVFDDKRHYLGSQAGRWVNDDAFNLWITLNPEYASSLNGN